MFEIDYNFEESGSGEIMDPDEMSLRQRHFLGNLQFRKDDHSIEIDHQKVPIIDSAFSMIRICQGLIQKKDGREDFEFAQTNKKITFHKVDGRVKIVPSFSVTTLEMTMDDFRDGIKKFYRKVLIEVMKKSSSLKMNALLFGYLQDSETM
jgi:UDP-3-O-acyl-N-acetylglucosamine deacetylase